MFETLDRLLAWARTQPPMTEAEQLEQTKSWVYGEHKLAGGTMTREEIGVLVDRLRSTNA